MLVNPWRLSNIRGHKLPTRVLDVRPNVEHGKVFLMETNDVEGKYATLSHFWGGVVTLSTKLATVESRKMGIPLVDLPQKFQDTVMVTRRLEIPFLWIDSLQAGLHNRFSSKLSLFSLEITSSECRTIHISNTKPFKI